MIGTPGASAAATAASRCRSSGQPVMLRVSLVPAGAGTGSQARPRARLPGGDESMAPARGCTAIATA